MVDKPAGCTSHDVVARARRQLGERRVGHAGTLDPDATGVLVLGVGNGTRLLRFVDGTKAYVGEIVLGATTTTLDDSGEVTARFDMSGVTLADAVAAAARLTGEIDQVPPMVSAVHVDGVRLHELARQGIEVERAPRRVTVFRFDIESVDPRIDIDSAPTVLRCVVECSSGTYVRSLADDLGRLLGGGAHLRRLRRTRVGPFTLADAVPLDELVPERLAPITAAVRDLDHVTVDDATAALVDHGRVLPPFGGDGPWAVLDGAGRLRAVYEPFRGQAKPALVIPVG